jgi:hypothetical protein
MGNSESRVLQKWRGNTLTTPREQACKLPQQSPIHFERAIDMFPYTGATAVTIIRFLVGARWKMSASTERKFLPPAVSPLHLRSRMVRITSFRLDRPTGPLLALPLLVCVLS